MTAQPVTGELGPKQQTSVDGPNFGPDMATYVCVGCSRQYFDTGLYFYGINSTRCIWCTKFPKGSKR
jgi:hypothetical protein